MAAFAKATEKAAEEAGVAYVNLFDPTQKLYQASKEPLTLNGVHLNELGNRKLGQIIAQALLGTEVADYGKLEDLRLAVLEKNLHWFNRYRATDGNDIWGGRSNLRFVDDQSNAEVLQHELVMRDVLTANRDKLIWATAQGKKYKVNDSNVPVPIKVVSNVGGGSRSSNPGKEGTTKYLSPEASNNREAISSID